MYYPKLIKTSATARRAAFERRAAENRKRIECRQDLMKSIQKDNIMLANASSDVRVEHKRRIRQNEIENNEKQMLESFYKVLIENHLRSKKGLRKYKRKWNWKRQLSRKWNQSTIRK
jgi:hypothetical protein